MKSFRSLFYTRPSKVIMLILLLILSIGIAQCQTSYFELHRQDNASFNNAARQMDNFDYETSYYFRNTVETTIENVVALTMDYPEVFTQQKSEEEFLAYYKSIGDTTFEKIYNNLSSLHGLRFAVINHGEKKVYSNIDKINGAAINEKVRRHFGQSGKMLLIARSCRAPYFETDSFIDYAEHIRDCADKYEDNFDLLISFGDDETFYENAEKYSRIHFQMREKIERLNNTVAIVVAFTLAITVCILTVTGRYEPGGKIYPSKSNKLPNDLIVVSYVFMLVCLVSLYRTSLHMLFSYRLENEVFWFTRSEAFYASRVEFCIVAFICLFVNMLCILKRSYQMGQLVKNTYLYEPIMNIKKRIASKQKSDENKDKM